MATFGQICQSVLEESDGRVELFTTTNLGFDANDELYVPDPTQRNVIRWVKEAYKRILLHSDQWSFLHRRGLFLRVRASQTTYVKTTTDTVDRCSLYLVPDGSTARTPVFIEDYDWWVQNERTGPPTSGAPLYLVETPEDRWIVWPTPVADAEIYGDWWVKADDLTNVNDVPVWDEAYHDLLKWEAVRMFAMEFQDSQTAPQLLNRVNAWLPHLWRRFLAEYLPSIGSAEPYQF